MGRRVGAVGGGVAGEAKGVETRGGFGGGWGSEYVAWGS